MTLWSKNAFIFAEFLHHGTDKTQAATTSMEEGLHLHCKKHCFQLPKAERIKEKNKLFAFFLPF